jgi:tetrahydromethanopterin S-methyltransferase subunit G
MEPRDDLPYDESDHDPLIRELRAEMVRLQARLDQLTAATRDQAEEAAELRARLTELEIAVGRLRERYRRASRFWGVIGLFYGAAIGMWVSWLFR